MEKSKKNRLFGHPAGKRRSGPNPTQIICVSFLVVITLGTLLLTTPLASKQGRLGVVDALFTATSATCVTGLIVRDTWTQFSYFGQAVILVLIQVGGLGLVTLTSFFALAMRRRMGFRDLRLMGESVSADGYAQAKEVLKTVVGLAALFEGIGILLLLFAFVPQFGLEGIWVSVFTAISAFCNAGFDLFGRFGQYSSLVPYVSNYYVQAVVMFMIIAGGLGFMVWVEIGQFHKKHRLSLQAKVVLSFSVILWFGGAALIALMEWNNPASMGGLERARQADGGPVPVRVHPYCRHEHHRPCRLRSHHQAAHERAAVHRRGPRLHGRRREGDHLCGHHPDHPQCGPGPRRLRDRGTPHRIEDRVPRHDHHRHRCAGSFRLGGGGVL